MKIVMIDEIANCAYHLTKGLTQRGHEVLVLLDVNRKLNRLLFTHSVPKGAKVVWIRPFPIGPRAFGLFFPMLFAILRFRPHIIHVQYLWSQFIIGFIAARLLRIPIVGTGHGWEVMDVPKWRIRGTIQRFFLKRADMIILTAEYFFPYMDGVVPPEKLVYIHRMIDTDFFRPAVECDDLIEKYGNHIVTFVARLYKIKTPYKTLKAFREALEEFPDARLLIMGLGPEMEAMKQYVKDHKMDHAVVFLGEVPNTDIPKYFSASKVEVRKFNPLTPDLCISSMEALACGIPLITFIEFENTKGIIVVLKDEDIAEALKNVLRNPEYGKKLGMEGRQYIIENFSIQQGAAKTLKVYEQVLRRRKQWPQK
jgi:glycosyltransferase involved in cell wall biosynthesis